jgi:sialate O-acetylesterase
MNNRFLVGVVCLLTLSARAAVSVPGTFSDHMVIQRGMDVPVWGQARAGEQVTIEFPGKTVSTTADQNGQWSVKLPAMKASSSAASLTIRGEGDSEAALVIRDVLVGDVWICSGQSNMQWPVKQANNAEKEIESANYPQIRALPVPRVTATQPSKQLNAQWEVCSPKTVGEFSAVGYFFGREIHQREHVPIGLIMNPWGGKPIESFMSDEALRADPDFAPVLARKKQPTTKSVAQAKESFEKEKAAWEKTYLHQDPGNQGFGKGWANPDADDGDWKSMKLPQHWEATGLKIDGAVWFRKEVEIPAAWEGKELSLSLGGIDDTDTTYFNGKEIGKTQGPMAVTVQRQYAVPAELVKAGKAVIAVRVFDMLNDGGFYGPGTAMKLAPKDGDSGKNLGLDGQWKYKVERAIEQPASVPAPPLPSQFINSPFFASNIYNGMVAPLVPYAIKGVIWYQGESNADRAEQYRKLFPALIRDWRTQWHEGEFPFLFVQLANYGPKGRPEQPADSAWAELREAQTMTLVASPNTAMAVIIDIGESKSIHPKNKQDVGKRSALAAEKIAYGKADIQYSGPIYQLINVENGKVRITFDHARGLKTKDGGPPKGFQIAGEDRKWVWADAKIDGRDVIVWSDAVKKPMAVRYGWGDDPVTNLYNDADLPASPFRTDDWPMVTAGKK